MRKIHIIPGWYEDTVSVQAAKIKQIAVLHVDCDWYGGTRLVLEHLAPLVVRGGIIIVDDYGHWEGCARAVAEWLSANAPSVQVKRVPASPQAWWEVA